MPTKSEAQRTAILSVLLLAVLASFFVYARRPGDFAGYVAAGDAVIQGRDLYLGPLWGVNTWPPFFSLVCVPLALIDKLSPYFARIIWIALTWASIVWSFDLIARLVYAKRLAWRANESSLDLTSPELLIPFVLTIPYLLNNFELLQINTILFALVLWGLFLQANGRAVAGGIAIAAAAAMKVMAIAFLPYLIYRKRWRAAFWTALASAFLFLCPALIFGWAKFWKEFALWPASLRASWGSGNAQQSVYAMWDRILGYGFTPFAVPGSFELPMSGARGAKIAWGLTCVVVAVLGAIAFRGTPKPDSCWAQVEWAAVSVAATVLSPLARKPFFVVLLLPNALLYAAVRSRELDQRLRRVLTAVLITSFVLSLPTLHDLIGKSLAVRLEMGSVVTFAALIVLAGLLWHRSRAPREELE